EEAVSATLRDLGVDLGALYERFHEEVKGERAVMALAREESDAFLHAMRAELVMNELALKREAVRCTSLSRLADRGRRGGPLTEVEIAQARRKLCELVDAVDAKTAVETVGWWGVAPEAAAAFVETLAFARRFAASTRPGPRRARPREKLDGLELR